MNHADYSKCIHVYYSKLLLRITLLLLVMVWVRVRVRVSASGSRFGFGGVWHGTKSFCVEMVLLYAYAWNNYTLTFCKHTYASFLLLKRWKQNRKHLVNTRKQK